MIPCQKAGDEEEVSEKRIRFLVAQNFETESSE